MRIEKWEKCLVMQILEMDERFRNDDFTSAMSYISANGVHIESSSSPNIHWDDIRDFYSIHLRGYDSPDDYKIVVKYFDNNNDRDKAYDLFVEALKDWAENWEGWKEKKKSKKIEMSDANILVF